MQLRKRIFHSMLSRMLIAATLFGGLLLFASAPSAKANDWDDCNRRAAYADWRYHQAVVHFGFYSPEARYWRHERYEAFARSEFYRRHEWRERAWREHEWRENKWREHHRHYRDRDGDWDRD
jgi:hypothetical protein